ncbi:hypothetical protein [Pseudonocardia endophytica]|uniref:Uncharacterized protein n=1 Tax=Pseudonocardia endophytica TaxID=401976 RepID=A0A4R1HJR3_PSEEN|nr:hypothetical protein [Pseudonocardia endophytica]TCK21231.1 hypothetical protein EV378_5211 [Pseudonocardia endophytica]
MNAARPGDRRPRPTGPPTEAEPTTRIPAARTEKLPAADAGATQQLPASHTEKIPETDPGRPTRAIRQVRHKADDGAWPAIPMLPVIKPDAEPLSEVDRVREQRGVRELREHMETWQDRDHDAPAWPEREDPPGTLYPPQS